MEIVYLLVPLSVVLTLLIMFVFWWAVHSGQFDDLERQGESVLDDNMPRPPGASDATPENRD